MTWRCSARTGWLCLRTWRPGHTQSFIMIPKRSSNVFPKTTSTLDLTRSITTSLSSKLYAVGSPRRRLNRSMTSLLAEVKVGSVLCSVTSTSVSTTWILRTICKWVYPSRQSKVTWVSPWRRQPSHSTLIVP